MSMNEEKSRLKGFKITDLVITETLIGSGSEKSLARFVYQIWTKDSELIATIDYTDDGYNAIESIFRGV